MSSLHKADKHKGETVTDKAEHIVWAVLVACMVAMVALAVSVWTPDAPAATPAPVTHSSVAPAVPGTYAGCEAEEAASMAEDGVHTACVDVTGPEGTEYTDGFREGASELWDCIKDAHTQGEKYPFTVCEESSIPE